MAFIELKLQLQREQADTLSDWLDDLGALAVTMIDAEDNPILEPGPGETPLWEQLVLTALFDAETDCDAVAAHLMAHIAWPTGTALRWQAVPDQDWIRVWMDRFQPIAFGQRLWVCPSWLPVPAEATVALLLDPGLAFGSGSHPTTRLCLEWLDGADLNGKHVLDYGCGSGILAIAAAKLGAAQLTAIDNDPQALLATRENATRNGLILDHATIALPPLNDDFRCDVIVANILAEPLRLLAPSFAQWLLPGGHLVLSGLLATQADEIISRYQTWFERLNVQQSEDWIRISGTRR